VQKITPFLWFDDQAEEAVSFYVSIFKNARIGRITHYGEEGAAVSGRPAGSVMTIDFEIEGQEFTALNGGPVFTFSPATSFVVNCQSQEEIDPLWEKLSAGGQKQQCGWLTDRFGVTWQIVPAELVPMLQDPDPAKAKRVMQAMLQMVKLDIAGLRRAYEGS
jgi:predicted 3-demethylubiquinone-9 3-methyltransferase (glyoxalase superfamily)